MKPGICSICKKEIQLLEDPEEYNICTGANCTDGKSYCNECYNEMNKRSENERFETILKTVMKTVKKTYTCPLNTYNQCDYQCNTKTELEIHIREKHCTNTSYLEHFGRKPNESSRKLRIL